MAFFRIVIPNYNNAIWLNNCINSVLTQTFQDFFLIVVDDCSTDNSMDILKNFEIKNPNKMLVYQNKKKRFNGGSRNVGMSLQKDSKYTLFLDSDDWFYTNDCFQKIYDKIVRSNYPDCISLTYICHYKENNWVQPQIRNTIQELVSNPSVACWTKCIKSNLMKEFPENTLMEDVVQHIAQCDVIKTITSIEEPIVVWNRDNLNSCSREENQGLKWKASMYRFCADLLELECKHDYCETERIKRKDNAIQNVREGKYIQ